MDKQKQEEWINNYDAIYDLLDKISNGSFISPKDNWHNLQAVTDGLMNMTKTNLSQKEKLKGYKPIGLNKLWVWLEKLRKKLGKKQGVKFSIEEHE